jgi:hypothetical protein
MIRDMGEHVRKRAHGHGLMICALCDAAVSVKTTMTLSHASTRRSSVLREFRCRWDGRRRIDCNRRGRLPALSAASHLYGLLAGHTLFATEISVVHRKYFGIPDSTLKPTAHEGACLFTRNARKAVDHAGKDRDPSPLGDGRFVLKERADKRWRIGETENDRAAGSNRRGRTGSRCLYCD